MLMEKEPDMKDSSEPTRSFFWRGSPVEELSKEALIEVINEMSIFIKKLRERHDAEREMLK